MDNRVVLQFWDVFSVIMNQGDYSDEIAVLQSEEFMLPWHTHRLSSERCDIQVQEVLKVISDI
jgi:hypothetical protein